jgi:hypothetical protein
MQPHPTFRQNQFHFVSFVVCVVRLCFFPGAPGFNPWLRLRSDFVEELL